MPFVRRKRDRVLLVHSARSREDGKVRQVTLATFGSPGELVEALDHWERWHTAVAWRHPDLEWNWSRIRERLEAELAPWAADHAEVIDRKAGRILRICDELVALIAEPDAVRVPQRQALLELRGRLAALSLEPEPTTPPEDPPMTPALLDPTPADRLFEAAMEHRWGGNATAAHRLFREVLELDPHYSDVHNSLGIDALERQELDIAEAHFRTAIEGGARHLHADGTGLLDWGWVENRPFLRGHANLALVLRERRDWEGAAAIHTQMMQFNPSDNQGVRFLIGEEHHHLGDLERARVAYERALEASDPGTAFSYALVLHQLGRHDEVSRPLLRGFAENRYIAPVLFGDPWTRLDAPHGTSDAEPEYAQDYVDRMGELWYADPTALDPLADWWNAAPVRAWMRAMDDIRVQLRDLRPGEERSRLVRELFEDLCGEHRIDALAALDPMADAEPLPVEWIGAIPDPRDERLAVGDTWVTDVTHLAPPGADVPKPALRLGAYFGRIVRAATASPGDLPFVTAIRCRRRPKRRPCPGSIIVVRDVTDACIHWECTRCRDCGVMRNWEGTRWDLGPLAKEERGLGGIRVEVTITEEDFAALVPFQEDLEGGAALAMARAAYWPDAVMLEGVEGSLTDLVEQVQGSCPGVAERTRQSIAGRR